MLSKGPNYCPIKPEDLGLNPYCDTTSFMPYIYVQISVRIAARRSTPADNSRHIPTA